MPQITVIHIASPSSSSRAAQAFFCRSLGFHAEIYSHFRELIFAAPKTGIAFIEDYEDGSGVSRFMSKSNLHGFWIPVIGTSANPQLPHAVQAVRDGALDYLRLPLDEEQVRNAVCNAEQRLDNALHVQRRSVEARNKLDALSPRELEVLDLLVEGESNKGIGRILNISPRTVEIHRSNIMAKLSVPNSACAIRIRVEASIGSFEPKWELQSASHEAEPPLLDKSPRVMLNDGAMPFANALNA